MGWLGVGEGVGRGGKLVSGMLPICPPDPYGPYPWRGHYVLVVTCQVEWGATWPPSRSVVAEMRSYTDGAVWWDCSIGYAQPDRSALTNRPISTFSS
jgi:hypothetical protein